MNLRISLFRNKRDNQPREATWTWAEFSERIAKPEIRAEKDGALFSPAIFESARRAKENAVELSLLALDYDHDADLERDLAAWRGLGYMFAVYTTHSHKRETESNPRAEDRFRVVIPLAASIPAARYSDLWHWAAAQSGGRIDPAPKDTSRIFYLPAKASEDAPYYYEIHDGRLLDWRELELEAELPRTKKHSPEGAQNGHSNYGRAALEKEIARVLATREPGRNHQLNRSAFALGQLVAGSELSESEVISTLENAARIVGLGENEILPTIHSGLEAGQREPRKAKAKTKPVTATPKEEDRSGQTDKISVGGTFFQINNAGVWATGESDDDKPIFVCSQLEIAADTRDERGENWGRLLRFPDRDGTTHQWAMPMELLNGDGREYRAELLRQGLVIGAGRKARNLLELYLNRKVEKKALCVSKIGWHRGAYILPDETIGAPDGEEIYLQTASANHLLRTSGTLEEWRENVSSYAVGNSRIAFAISTGFAAALLSIVGGEGGGFHFRSKSSFGKTTLLLVGGSVWGGGDTKHGYLRMWRATANGLEGVAVEHNDALLCLDEIAQIDPREAGEAAYMIANGQGKLRQNRNATLRRTSDWRLLFLSSGEVSLSDHVAQAGKRIRGGQEVRLVDLPADAGAGFGVFEELHSFANGDEFAQHLQQSSKRYYGTAIREFLRRVVAELDSIRAEADNSIQSFLKDNLGNVKNDGEIIRVARRIALVAYAGELASEYGITGWIDHEATASASNLFRDWLANRGTGGTDTENQIAQVRLFLEQHGQSRFQRLGVSDDRAIINRAGYVEALEDGEGLIYYILPEVFRAEVCKGFDAKDVLKALKERQFLIYSDGYRFQKRTPEGNPKLYAIQSAILE